MVDMSARDRDPIAALDPLDVRPVINQGPVRYTSGSRDLPITGPEAAERVKAGAAVLAAARGVLDDSAPTLVEAVRARLTVEPVRALGMEPRRPATRPSMLEIFEETQERFPVIMARLAE